MRLPSPRSFFHHTSSAILGAVLALGPASPIAPDREQTKPSVVLVNKKERNASSLEDREPAQAKPHLATLVNMHSGEVLVLDEQEPTQDSFSQFLIDRVTNSKTAMASELIEVLRTLVVCRGKSRVEIVSGYRSWKLNEVLRKKGRRVASHSEHSLGQAVDFRIVGVPLEELREQVEDLKWQGGLGYYPLATDRFIHVDIGKNRRWRGK